ncbi:MAG: EboA domain-containing protein [Planctomycetota bacterium]|jgi:hypothetical protein
MLKTPDQLLEHWITRDASPAAASWLAGRIDHVHATREAAGLFTAFALARRKLGRGEISLTEDDLAAATEAHTGWIPRKWTLAQAARTRLILAYSLHGTGPLVTALDQLFATADLGEQVTLYQMLPLLPDPEAQRLRAAEGLRTNIKEVFEAVAHKNPYPAQHLAEAPFNQMVLKALFIGVTLWPIQGLEARANPRLAAMLIDYAHERQAAGRSVWPELWRLVGPHADDAALEDLGRVLKSGASFERHAAARALRSCPRPGAAALLAEHKDLEGDLPTWPAIADAAAAAAATL